MDFSFISVSRLSLQLPIGVILALGPSFSVVLGDWHSFSFDLG